MTRYEGWKMVWDGYRPPVRIRVKPWKLWISFGHRADVQLSLLLDQWNFWIPKLGPKHCLGVCWLGPVYVIWHRKSQ